MLISFLLSFIYTLLPNTSLEDKVPEPTFIKTTSLDVSTLGHGNILGPAECVPMIKSWPCTCKAFISDPYTIFLALQEFPLKLLL